MLTRCSGAVAAACVLASAAVVNIAPADAVPLPEFCVPSRVVDTVCTARLTSVTADAVDGTITGNAGRRRSRDHPCGTGRRLPEVGGVRRHTAGPGSAVG